ncbi:hypothetical protein CN514_21810 [Bacillus sp. AFS001701]|uniref:tyrosine-type recombinase/integrase n=1 Tax=Bacillus sp. AFS001701 TaxID=2033480 RepID=UPI000BF91BD0|nr:site-specific integrase [Bacillus sp. AFS001701]PET44462.1 hypothetical protein CN514_21810 [Bacillus sp. AFS001701]
MKKINITEINHELNKIVQETNLIPTIKSTLEMDLSTNIPKAKVKSIFSQEGIDNLDSNELTHLLQVFFKITKNNIFNPMILSDGEDLPKFIDEKGNEIKYADIPELYFNFEYKDKFTDKYKGDGKRVAMNLFRKTAEMEKGLGKDLFDFTHVELQELVISLHLTTVQSLQNTMATIRQYIDFAIKHSLTINKKNYAKSFSDRDTLKPLLYKVELFPKDEVYAMANQTENDQDAVLLALIFEGVSIKNGFKEIINLKQSDIDFENNIIHLPNRTLLVSKETIVVVRGAINQMTYVSINGETSRVYELTASNKVVRALRGKETKSQIISQRILRISKQWDYKYLNATTISQSGMVRFADVQLEQGLEINEVVDMTLERFNMPINQPSRHSLRELIKEYIVL